MKKLVLFMLIFLLLAGCAADTEPTETPTVPTTAPTEPPVPWTQAVGMPWDTDGVLLEMPLTIPDGLHYSSMMGFGGDLLLWSIDIHISDQSVMEMCLLELDDGTVVAQCEIPVGVYLVPQILGDDMFLCDPSTGKILQMDKNLQTVKEWNVEPMDGTWYMGSGGILYHLDLESHLTARNLSTGTVTPVMEGNPEVTWINGTGRYVSMDYFRIDTGIQDVAVLDLQTGAVHYPAIEGSFNTAAFMNDDWLCTKYTNENISYLSVDGGESMMINAADSNLSLLKEGYLLEKSVDSGRMAIYDMEGKLISTAVIYDGESIYPNSDLIWNETLGGYFMEVRSYPESSRLLFWDISRSSEGEDLVLTKIPAPDEAQALLQQRAQELGEKYGLTILIGADCDTVFAEFTAEQVIEYDRVAAALDTLEEALDQYPEGFLRQLRYGSIRGIRIQLISNLWADGSGRYGDGYAAFTEPMWDHYLMVIDIDDTYVQTYYHEFSHIIDSYLEWDSQQRSEALFSELSWGYLNPDWFTGYSYDYAQEHHLYDNSSFIDGYSTVSPTEDRARVMEYAMGGSDWVFDEAPVLRDKLYYYCNCIREAFDTEGWPETTLWEMPLE